MACSQLYKTSSCFFSTPDKAVHEILVFRRSLDHLILPFQRILICKKKFDAHESKYFFFTSTTWWPSCLQLFWCEKAIVYSSFGINILLFGLKKRSSNHIVSPFSKKRIGVHHEVARAVVRAPTAKKLTSTKFACYHFLNVIWTRVWFPRAHPHSVWQSILQ